MKCAEPACSNCVINEHLDHESEVNAYNEGIETMRKKIKQGEGKLDVLIKSAFKLRERHKVNTAKIKDSISKVKDIEAYYRNKLYETTETLKMLEEIAIEADSTMANYEETVEEWITAKHSIPKTLDELKQGNFVNYSNFKQKMDQILKEELNRIKYDHPVIEIEDPKTRTILNLTNVRKPDVYLKEPIFIKEIQCPNNAEWQGLYNISSTGNDSVLISDWGKPYITCAYSSDKATTTIPAVHGEVRDACVYHGYLYTAYKDCVTKRTYNGNTGEEEMLKLNIKDIYSMVVNDKCV